MVLALLESIYTSPSFAWPRAHLPHILFALLAIYTLRALSQGRRTTRDRDLHARTVILTGAFDSALGVTLLVELARRGAGVVCLTGRDVGTGASTSLSASTAATTKSKAKEEEEKHPYSDDDAEDDTHLEYPLPTSPDPENDDPSAYGDPHIHTLITLVRSTTKNPNIWAETCDIEDAESVKRFCMRWLTGGGAGGLTEEGLKEKEKDRAQEPQMPGLSPPAGAAGSAPADNRLDALIFTHEYPSLGSLLPTPSWFPALYERASTSEADNAKRRERRSLGSFLMTTLLLPSLLVAPTERDIRIVNVVNPFYAAAVRSVDELTGVNVLDSTTGNEEGRKEGKKTASVFLKEGIRSLRTVVLTRHLQRILDALPAPQAPNTSTSSTAVPIPSRKAQKSNIIAVSVSPGVSRVDTVAPLLEAAWDVEGGRGWSGLGVVIYILLQPLLRIFTKSPTSAVQSVLHAVFLPTAFKSMAARMDGDDGAVGSGVSGETKGKEGEKGKERRTIGFREVLKPGALYGECAVVTLDGLRPLPASSSSNASNATKAKSKKDTDKASKVGKAEELDVTIEDDGEYGGEEVGRRVWEAFEAGLKVWEGKGSAAKA